MNPYQQWLKKLLVSFLAVFLLLGLPIVAFTYLVDPLWLFQHENKWNHIQQGFNERQQKVNRLTFANEGVDALLVGSSRTTYINEHHFKDLNVFNLAVSSMLVEEYDGYIDYAEKVHGKPYDYIFLGLDFFATNKHRINNNPPPATYIEEATSYLYRVKTLASFDTVKKAWPAFQSSRTDQLTFTDHRYYDRQNVAYPFPVSADTVSRRMQTYLYEFYKGNEQYEYDPRVAEMLKEVKAHHPDTKFVVFTTPETQARMVNQLEHLEYWKGYERWLRDLTATFGEVYHFMNINEVTKHHTNFTDSHHFTPETGNLIVDRIWNEREQGEKIRQFGVVVNQENVASELALVKRSLVEEKATTFDFLKPSGRAPILEQSLSRGDDFSGSWSDLALQPAKVLGVKGAFTFSLGQDGLMVAPLEGSISEGQTIQIGYDAKSLLAGPLPKKLTFVVTLKGDVGLDGAVQLFIQDEVNGQWERVQYTAHLSPTQTRGFTVTKDIRADSTQALLGIKWTNIQSPTQTLTIQTASIY